MRLPRPRVTVNRLMLAVLLVAANFAILRAWREVQWDFGIAFVVLPMASLLAFVAPAALWRRGPGAFWVGFEVAGWLAVASCGYLAYHHGAAFFGPANAVYPWQRIMSPVARDGFVFALDLVIYMPPQVLVAWAGGRLTARWLRSSRSAEISAAPSPTASED